MPYRLLTALLLILVLAACTPAPADTSAPSATDSGPTDLPITPGPTATPPVPGVEENSYPDVTTAQEQLTDGTAWMLTILPPDATNIVEAHALNGSQQWLTWEYSAASFTTITAPCSRLTPDGATLPTVLPSWWGLTDTTNPNDVAYLCPNVGGILYYSTIEGRVFYWSVP